jgi:hypothetical protein
MTEVIIIEWVTGAAIAGVSFALGWYAATRRHRQSSR